MSIRRGNSVWYQLFPFFNVPLQVTMAKTGAADRTRFNVNEEYELNYWTGGLNVSEEKLKQAVSKVGTSVEAVKKHLGR
jgi:hypothetical protein